MFAITMLLTMFGMMIAIFLPLIILDEICVRREAAKRGLVKEKKAPKQHVPTAEELKNAKIAVVLALVLFGLCILGICMPR